jgi:MFS family permease
MRYFHNPAGKGLTLLNSMQVSISIKFNAYEFLSLALQTFGSLAALPMTPYVADGLGRRTSIFIGALVMCIAIAVQTAANSLGMFVAARYASYFIPTIVLTKNSDLYSVS